ncbi:aminopeptidase [Erysipelotrichaceae bacterium AF15-26LB]|nr:aminopeptidase I zinc metalloprotease (M18) [Erysipelotrichaceae bacterium 3_1_53]MCR0350550.1 aminopeptidase [[Clostridium] innocuum]RJV83724.1 aminopeptidase [Erysipelotrichaceae bacterium AF15-26LB]RJV86366.1 aminopeptidase [Erysipelotrichaceae bacterium AF19-24AC]
MRENAWKKYDEAGLKEVFDYCEGYKKYISDCKTERECVSESIRIAQAYGYRNLEDVIRNKETLKSGDKVYANNMGKGLALFLIGEEPMSNGFNILGAHVDSPRLDIKQNPLYEDKEFAMLDTHYYGGIKKYQWVTLPLALHGVVVKKDGTMITLNIGEDDNDPIVGISDLLVHLSADQMSKKASNVIEGEDLNVTLGSMPLNGEEKDAVKANILKLLKETYDFEEDDFVSAEIEVVPAGKARDYGLDRSMIAGYGHDDRICAYTSMMAQLETEAVKRTAVTLLVDKEEVGSIGATGQHSRFFENTVAEVMDRMGEYSELNVRRALKNSKMLSSDVSAAFDPNYAAVNEEKNSAFMGHGLVFNKYTGSRGKGGCNDANAEYMAELRNIMDSENVTFQTAELGKVDQGGGGTIAYILAQYNMEVIDSGIALHNMHAPWEIASKIDIWEATKGYKAFLKHA